MRYYIWTEGCQMNVAESQRVSSALEEMGYRRASKAEEADVVVLNTCMVRQSAENKAYNHLQQIKALKLKKPDLVLNLMGCMVGIKDNPKLRKRFPFVDVFSPPSDIKNLVTYLLEKESVEDGEERLIEEHIAGISSLLQTLPAHEQGKLVSAYIPIVNGCSHACAYCIIPYKRGVEISRPSEDILNEAKFLVSQGVREITLLGQIVDRYGRDNDHYPSLAGLLKKLNSIEGLHRIRFLTSHPNWMTDELLESVAELPKVMPHIEVPAQAGDDEVLANMRRGYSSDDYRRLIEKIRRYIPGVSIGTDIIVGFPGETEEQFQHTYDLLEELKMDVAHLARYSPRKGTLSARMMPDDVPAAEKMRRFRLLEELQKEIITQINAQYQDTIVTVLFEEKVKNRWKGRTPTNRLVFVESEQHLAGRMLPVEVFWAGPWSLIGRLFKDEDGENQQNSLVALDVNKNI